MDANSIMSQQGPNQLVQPGSTSLTEANRRLSSRSFGKRKAESNFGEEKNPVYNFINFYPLLGWGCS